MTIDAFIQTYTLHDSIVKHIRYDRENKELHLTIDFCWYMQKDYHENSGVPEIVELVFCTVPSYRGLLGDIDDYSILNMEAGGNDVEIMLLDDFHDQLYRLAFCADQVYMREAVK